MTLKYILLKVEIEHEPDAEPDDIAAEVEVHYDDTDGTVTKSEVVAVGNSPSLLRYISDKKKPG
jgi:hypothetical protein